MNIQQMIDQRKITVENLNTQTSAITNTIFDNKDMLAEIINFLVEDYGYYFEEDFIDPISEYKKMNSNTKILSKIDEHGNSGWENYYDLDQAILENLHALLPIIKKYDVQPEIKELTKPVNGIINGIEVDYGFFDTVSYAVGLFEEHPEKTDLNPTELTAALVGLVDRIYCKFEYSTFQEIENELYSYLEEGYVDSSYEDIFESYIPLKSQETSIDVSNYTPKINHEILEATEYFKKYEPVIDLYRQEVENEITFHVNGRNVDFSIKYAQDEYDLAGVYWLDDHDFEDVYYGTWKTLDEVCDYLIQDHLQAGIEQSLKQPPLLSAEDHFSTQQTNVEPSSIEM